MIWKGGWAVAFLDKTQQKIGRGFLNNSTILILLIIGIAAGLVSLAFALLTAHSINKKDAGNDRMREIAKNIEDGAKAFLYSEYKILVFFVIALAILITILIDYKTALCFLLGALFSTLAGYLGMTVATRANVRTANAAKESGMSNALKVAFSGGAVMGLSVVGLGVVGIAAIFLIVSRTTKLVNSGDALSILTGFSLGASSIALFARVGGGTSLTSASVSV